MLDDLTTLLIVLIGMAGVVALRYLKLKSQTAGQMSTQEVAAVEQIAELAQRLEQRVATLERVLDAEVPNWRQSNDFGAHSHEKI